MDRLAYLFDEAELASVLPDWPAGLCVALCLDRDGAMQVAFLRAAEPERFLERIREATAWKDGEFAVFPAQDGVPTVRLLYSEAQWFLRIVAEIEGLPGMAQDFLSPPKPEPEPERGPDLLRARRRPRTPIASSGLLPGRRRGSALASAAPAGHLPPGYRAAESLADAPMDLLAGRITSSGARIRVMVEPDKVSDSAMPVRAEPLGFRDDMRAFMLERDVLVAAGPGQGAVVDLPMTSFPKALATRFAQVAHAAEITVTPEGIFVQIGTPERPAAPLPDPERTRAPAKRWRPLALTLTVVAAVLVSGSVVTALQIRDDWRVSLLDYRPAEGNSALNVLESFAASDPEDGR